MKKTNYFVITLVAITLMTFSCKKREVADVTIKYEISATTAGRPYTIYYSNLTDAYDVEQNYANVLFTESFDIPSNSSVKTFSLKASCPESYPNSISQVLHLKIYEDNVLIADKRIGGSAYISFDDTYVSADLPTKIKYKD